MSTVELNLVHLAVARRTAIVAFATFSCAGRFSAMTARSTAGFFASSRVLAMIAALVGALMATGEFYIAFSSAEAKLKLF